jgi:hypothetical protein
MKRFRAYKFTPRPTSFYTRLAMPQKLQRIIGESPTLELTLKGIGPADVGRGSST